MILVIAIIALGALAMLLATLLLVKQQLEPSPILKILANYDEALAQEDEEALAVIFAYASQNRAWQRALERHVEDLLLLGKRREVSPLSFYDEMTTGEDEEDDEHDAV